MNYSLRGVRGESLRWAGLQFLWPAAATLPRGGVSRCSGRSGIKFLMESGKVRKKLHFHPRRALLGRRRQEKTDACCVAAALAEKSKLYFTSPLLPRLPALPVLPPLSLVPTPNIPHPSCLTSLP